MTLVTRLFPCLRVLACCGAALVAALPAMDVAAQQGARRGLAIGVPTEAPAPRSAGYALILNMLTYPATIPALPGLSRDLEHARTIARGFGVAEANMKEVAGASVNAATLLDELEALSRRSVGDEEILIHFSGYGTSACNGVTREPALLMADGSTLLESVFDEQLSELAGKVRRVIAFVDVGRGLPEPTSPGIADGVLVGKYQPAYSDCAATGMARGLALGKDPLVSGNLVKLNGVMPGEPAFDSADSGGLASHAWAQCMAGGAQDSDASSGISVHELQACAASGQRDLVASLGNSSRRQEQAEPRPEAEFAATLQGNAEMVIAEAAPERIDPLRSGPDPLEALQDIHANRDARRQVTLQPSQPKYRIGKDYVQFDIHSSHAGHVYLLMLGSDGQTFDLLFPNRKDADNRIEAEETLQLPRTSWRLKPGGPAGVNHVLALVTDMPRDFSGLALRSAGPFSLAETTLANTRGLRMSSENAAKTPSCQQRARTRTLFITETEAEPAAAPQATEIPAKPSCSNSYGAALVQIVEVD